MKQIKEIKREYNEPEKDEGMGMINIQKKNIYNTVKQG